MKHRTQLLLEAGHYAYLKREAKARRCSLSGALRNLLDEQMRREMAPAETGEDAILKIAGSFRSGHSNTSSRDEEILYGRDAEPSHLS